MFKQHRFICGSLGVLVALAGPGLSSAQPPVRDEARIERRDEKQDVRKAKQILGAPMSINGGHAIGTIEDIVFSDDGYVEYLVVQNEGKYVLVPWEAAKFDLGHRVATVNITQERFREVPTFTSEKWPSIYEPAYRDRLYNFYGVKPRVERRIERREGTGRNVHPLVHSEFWQGLRPAS